MLCKSSFQANGGGLMALNGACIMRMAQILKDLSHALLVKHKNGEFQIKLEEM